MSLRPGDIYESVGGPQGTVYGTLVSEDGETATLSLDGYTVEVPVRTLAPMDDDNE